MYLVILEKIESSILNGLGYIVRLEKKNGNDEKNLSENDLLFIIVSVGKSLLGKFSYGHKLRSSLSKKLVIKYLVLYTNQKISASKKAIANNKE